MNESSVPKNQKLNLSFDYRLVALVLAAVIVVMLIIWKPWGGKQVTDRTVDVTGSATVSARPDEFAFYPTYEFTKSNKDTAVAELSSKSNTIVAELKKLGVPDKGIKVNSDSWSYPAIMVEGNTSTPTYTLRLTITVGNESLAQKVQDYLLTTSPSGAVSPQPTFSDAKRKELEDKARVEASKDARTKAEQSAKNLGFKLAAVKSVNDGTGFGGIYPLYDKANSMSAMDSVQPTMTIQPGENDLTYTVTVTYYIK
jgi:uncharacterized protein YggE